ncbi:MAG: hypothetical protein MJ131_03020 [Lachnospiraceae bacterium]|nr:hypothetical protein [Lachnospiraceae bacterium]
MDQGLKNNINNVVSSINSRINELTEISNGLRGSAFKNIGTEKCANKIDGVISDLRKARNKLNSME